MLDDDFGLVNDNILACDYFLQNYNHKVSFLITNFISIKQHCDWQVYLWHAEKLVDGKDSLLTADNQPKEEEPVMGAIDVDAHIDEVSNGSGEKKRSPKEVFGNCAAKKARSSKKFH